MADKPPCGNEAEHYPHGYEGSIYRQADGTWGGCPGVAPVEQPTCKHGKTKPHGCGPEHEPGNWCPGPAVSPPSGTASDPRTYRTSARELEAVLKDHASRSEGCVVCGGDIQRCWHDVDRPKPAGAQQAASEALADELEREATQWHEVPEKALFRRAAAALRAKAKPQLTDDMIEAEVWADPHRNYSEEQAFRNGAKWARTFLETKEPEL